MAILTFAERELESFFFTGQLGKKHGWQAVQKIAKRKLDMLHYSSRLDDLRSPPGNRLEALRGSLLGFYSVRINDQWRIVFRWTALGATDVDIVDYH